MVIDFVNDTDARLKVFKMNDLYLKEFLKWSNQDTVNTHFYKLIAFELEVLKDIYLKSRYNITTLSLKRIFPYGYVISENECYIKIPIEYKKFNNDKMAFMLSVFPSNRNIWHLLTLDEKYEFYDFLCTHTDYKLKHMNSPYYTCGDLADEILRFTIGESISIFTEYYQDRKNNKKIINDRFREISRDHVLQDSLLPFEICRFENFVVKHEGKDFKFYKYVTIDTKNTPRVHTGQYVVSLETR